MLSESTHAPQTPARNSAGGVLRLAHIDIAGVRTLLSRYGLELRIVAEGEVIPGSYWGDDEAGVIATAVYARSTTPVHSVLHEACHLIVADDDRRAQIDTDASDSQAEEDASCYLQIVLANTLDDVGSARVMSDMDAWGYTFRLGSARSWFERDAEDAQAWLGAKGLLDTGSRVCPALEGVQTGYASIEAALL